MSLQDFKKELGYKVDVLHANKHESLLQVDSIILSEFYQVCTEYSGKFAISLRYLKEEVRN